MTKLIAIAVCAFGFASQAHAECRDDSAKKPVTFHMETINGKSVMVFDGDAIIVCGHPARPGVVYVTTPKELDFSWLSLEQALLPRILESVNAAPFGGTR